jgi:hypothetical protein
MHTQPITYRELYDELGGVLDHLRCDIAANHSQIQNIMHLRARISRTIDDVGHKSPKWRNMRRPIVCVDFDGVLHSYKTPWEGESIIRDEPIPGAIDWLIEAVKHFQVFIFSTRCNDPRGCIAIREWLVAHGLPLDVMKQIILEPGKPSWFIHIDDRAIQFCGDWSSLDPKRLRENFKPWYYSVPGWRDDVAQDAEVNNGGNNRSNA